MVPDLEDWETSDTYKCPIHNTEMKFARDGAKTMYRCWLWYCSAGWDIID